MVQPSTSPLFDSFMQNAQAHKEIVRSIARAEASLADTIARTTRTIAESRALLECVSHIPDER